MWSITGWETYFPQRCKSHELYVTNTGFAAALSESVVPLALCQNSGGGNVAVGVGFDLTIAYSGVFAYSAGSGPVSTIGSAQPTALGRHFVSAIELVDSAESLMCYGNVGA
jgi:hypothetical protein